MVRTFTAERDLLRVRLAERPALLVVTIEIDKSNRCSVIPHQAAFAHSTAAALWGQIVRRDLVLLAKHEDDGERSRESVYFVMDVRDGERLIDRRSGLSSGELDVIEHSISGMSTKAIAHVLGISSSIVSQRLGTAAIKLGVENRTELVRLAAALLLGTTSRPDMNMVEEVVRSASAATLPSAAWMSRLTEAELAVLHLLQEGMTNEQIALVRARSVRTIANQVAALLRKTRAPTRRSLAIQSLK